MRNLLINLTFIFILVLGSSSDAFSQFIEVSAKYDIGAVEIFPLMTFGSSSGFNENRIPNDASKVTVTISESESGKEPIGSYTELYATNMRINIPDQEIKNLIPGVTYFITVKINDVIVGTKDILID